MYLAGAPPAGMAVGCWSDASVCSDTQTFWTCSRPCFPTLTRRPGPASPSVASLPAWSRWPPSWSTGETPAGEASVKESGWRARAEIFNRGSKFDLLTRARPSQRGNACGAASAAAAPRPCRSRVILFWSNTGAEATATDGAECHICGALEVSGVRWLQGLFHKEDQSCF